MKRFLKVTIFVIIVFIILFFFGIGGKRTDVFLHSFTVSEDGTKINLKVGVSSSAGYIRSLYVKQGGDNKYITFFSTFGINNKLGAKNEFEIELNPSCEEIFFYKGDGGYKLILQKNANGEWEINRKNENGFIEQNGEFQSRGLFDLGDGLTYYEIDLMANDMTWNAEPRLYHKIISNIEDYNKYQDRLKQLPQMTETDFNDKCMVILANENVRYEGEEDLEIYNVRFEQNSTYITLKQKQNPDINSNKNIFYAILNKNAIKDNIVVEIEK